MRCNTCKITPANARLMRSAWHRPSGAKTLAQPCFLQAVQPVQGVVTAYRTSGDTQIAVLLVAQHRSRLSCEKPLSLVQRASKLQKPKRELVPSARLSTSQRLSQHARRTSPPLRGRASRQEDSRYQPSWPSGRRGGRRPRPARRPRRDVDAQAPPPPEIGLYDLPTAPPPTTQRPSPPPPTPREEAKEPPAPPPRPRRARDAEGKLSRKERKRQRGHCQKSRRRGAGEKDDARGARGARAAYRREIDDARRSLVGRRRSRLGLVKDSERSAATSSLRSPRCGARSRARRTVGRGRTTRRPSKCWAGELVAMKLRAAELNDARRSTTTRHWCAARRRLDSCYPVVRSGVTKFSERVAVLGRASPWGGPARADSSAAGAFEG